MTRQVARNFAFLLALLVFSPSNAHANAVILWNENAAKAAAAACLHISGNGLVESRMYAMVHAAVPADMQARGGRGPRGILVPQDDGVCMGVARREDEQRKEKGDVSGDLTCHEYSVPEAGAVRAGTVFTWVSGNSEQDLQRVRRRMVFFLRATSSVWANGPTRPRPLARERHRLPAGLQWPGMPEPQDITVLLKAWGNGDSDALEQLMPLVYTQLRAQARRYVRNERAGATLQGTALVHKLYVRLASGQDVACTDRAHFFALSAQIMRRILVDAARARTASKRGGAAPRPEHASAIDLDQIPAAHSQAAVMLCALDDALESLAQLDPRRAKVIELRFFVGLSVDETADLLHVSPQTVMRDWRLAKVWLASQLRTADPQQCDVTGRTGCATAPVSLGSA